MKSMCYIGKGTLTGEKKIWEETPKHTGLGICF